MLTVLPRFFARYLCRKFGFVPTSLRDDALSEQAIEFCTGFHTLLAKAHYSPDRTAAMDALFAGNGPLIWKLRALETTFVDRDGKDKTVFLGAEPTPGDCAVAAACDFVALLEPGWLGQFPNLTRLYEHVIARPAVKAYLGTVPHCGFKRRSDPTAPAADPDPTPAATADINAVQVPTTADGGVAPADAAASPATREPLYTMR